MHRLRVLLVALALLATGALALALPMPAATVAQVPPTCEPLTGRHCGTANTVTVTPDGTRPPTFTPTPTAPATPCTRRGLPCDF